MAGKVGFIGLGIMGKPMARNLLKAGYELVVYTRSREKADELVEEGATAAASPREVAEQSNGSYHAPDSPRSGGSRRGDGVSRALKKARCSWT